MQTTELRNNQIDQQNQSCRSVSWFQCFPYLQIQKSKPDLSVIRIDSENVWGHSRVRGVKEASHLWLTASMPSLFFPTPPPPPLSFLVDSGKVHLMLQERVWPHIWTKKFSGCIHQNNFSTIKHLLALISLVIWQFKNSFFQPYIWEKNPSCDIMN